MKTYHRGLDFIIPPEKIYIQWKNDDGEEVDEVTWAVEPIYKYDKVYVYERSLSGGGG